MTALGKLVLVTDAPADSGLAYFYFRALQDICRIPTVLIASGPAYRDRSLSARIAMRIRRRSGIEAQSQLAHILKAIDGAPERTAIVLFNLGGLRAKELAVLRNSGARMYIYIPDSPFGMPPQYWSDVKSVLPHFNCVFTFTKDLVPVYYQHHANRVRRLPFAYCRYAHLRNATSICAPDGRLYYFGTWGPLIEEWLAPLTEFDLVVHGHGWGRASHPQLRAAARHSAAIDGDMASAASGQLVVNFVRAQHGATHSMKTFELPAAGACVVSNRSEEQLEFFPEESGVSYFNTAAEMLNLVREFIADPGRMAKNVARRSEYLAKQTYHERARDMLEELERE